MLQAKYSKYFIGVERIKRLRRFSTCLLHCFLFSLLMFAAHNSDAQNDTTAIDTVSMSAIDSITQLNSNEYNDSTIKHIYDTSQYFFNTKENWNDAYAKQKFTQRYLIDSDVKVLKAQYDFWYVPAAEKLENRLKTDAKFRDSLLAVKNHQLTDDNENSFLASSWFNFFIWFIVVVIFLAAIIYFLSQNKINLFSRQSALANEEEQVDEDEDIFTLNYHKLIQHAEKEKAYRIVVRLLYLQTLKVLSDTSVIQYQPDYTNLQYLQQLHQTKYYNDFFKLTRSYEYIWFGKFEISNQQYALIKNDFLKFQSRIT